MIHPSENLSAYLDGELTDAEARALEAQLAQDPSLLAELNELRDVQDFIRSHGPTQAPPGFYAKVLSSIEEEPMQRSWWAWLSRPFGLPVQGLAVAAVAALVLILAIPFGAQQFILNTPGMKKSGDDMASASSYGRNPRETRADDRKEIDEKKAPAQAPFDEAQKQKQGSAQDNKIQDMLNIAPDALEPDDALEGLKQEAVGSASGGLDEWGEKGSDAAKDVPADEAGSNKSAPKTKLTAPGYVYTIRTEDPEILYSLNALVKRYGGQLLDSRGRPLKPSQLSAGDAFDVQVFINEKTLNKLDRQLGTLGVVKRETPTSTELTTGGLHRLKIKLRVNGEATAPDGAKYEPTYPTKKKERPNSKKSDPLTDQLK